MGRRPDTRCAMPLAALVAGAACLLALAAVGRQARGNDAGEPTGCQIGAEVPTFFVRDVTSRQPAAATCLVCRYGSRPVVLVSSRHLDKQVAKLVQELDRVVDANRGRGLRGFGIFLTESPQQMQPRLMSLARRGQITVLPLTIPVESADGPRELALPRQADTVVLLYVQRKIVAAFAFDPGELDDADIRRVAGAARRLAGGQTEFSEQARTSDAAE